MREFSFVCDGQVVVCEVARSEDMPTEPITGAMRLGDGYVVFTAHATYRARPMKR